MPQARIDEAHDSLDPKEAMKALLMEVEFNMPRFDSQNAKRKSDELEAAKAAELEETVPDKAPLKPPPAHEVFKIRSDKVWHEALKDWHAAFGKLLVGLNGQPRDVSSATFDLRHVIASFSIEAELDDDARKNKFREAAQSFLGGAVYEDSSISFYDLAVCATWITHEAVLSALLAQSEEEGRRKERTSAAQELKQFSAKFDRFEPRVNASVSALALRAHPLFRAPAYIVPT